MFNIRTKISIIWQHAKYPLCFYAPKQQALTSCTIHPNAILHSRAIHTNDANRLRVICPNDINRFMRNLLKRNRRGGACVPARTSAQRRFHTKNMRIVCGEFNDGCALVGRHGRAHRHRPYQSP